MINDIPQLIADSEAFRTSVISEIHKEIAHQVFGNPTRYPSSDSRIQEQSTMGLGSFSQYGSGIRRYGVQVTGK